MEKELIMNDSLLEGHEDLRQNRKFMAYVLRSLKEKKIKQVELLQKECYEILKQSNTDITKLLDEDKNNLKEEKALSLKAIVEAYYILLEDKEKFFDWITKENSENMTPLEIAVQYSNTEIIKYLFETLKKTNEDKLKLTQHRNNLFHYAAKSNQSFPIIFFFDKLHGMFLQKDICIINIANQFGITPLHYACYFDSRRSIDLLLDLGANINVQDQDGATPLHYAIQRGSVRTIKKLLIRGANKAIPKFDKKKAYDLAVENNQFEVAKVLELKSLMRQYLCLETEIKPMRSSRNDLFLLVTILMIIIFKLIYILKINLMLNLNPQKSYLEDYVSCSFDTRCLFENIVTYSSLILDACILFIVVYFMCCDFSRSLFKSNKNCSKSISVKK